MKLSDVFAKLTSGKAKVVTTLGAMAIAGAAMAVSAPAADAQVAFGVAIGGPRYYAPAPVPAYRPYGYAAPGYVGYGYEAPGYWEHRRIDDWRAREWRDRAYVAHHDRGFYGRGGWR